MKNTLNQDVELQKFSLLDLLVIIQKAWKKLFIAAMIGALGGLIAWYALGAYTAKIVLLNESSINSGYVIDLVSWKTMQKSLPNLAAQLVDEGKVVGRELKTMEKLAREEWWQKNAIPSFAISKADIRELATISKDLDLASTTIVSLALTSSGLSRKDAIENVYVAANFLRTGGAYLQLRNLINGYKAEIIFSRSDIERQITSTEVEMSFQLQRAKNLEEIYKRFPGNPNSNQSVIDPRDSGAKYLSISTQIIAANNDINQSKENLQRLKERLDQISVLSFFIDKADPLLSQDFNGLELLTQLIEIEKKVREELVGDDIKKKGTLDNLRSSLYSIQARFSRGLEANTAPVVSIKDMQKLVIVSSAALFFLLLLSMVIARGEFKYINKE